MSTTTPNLTLTLYDSTTDQVVTFSTFRAVWGGTATTSNFYRIDTWAGTVNSAITTLQNQRGSIPVSASFVSANYYEATVSSITSYVTGMTILLKLDTTSSGTVTMNINSLGTKSVMKIDSSGEIVNISGAELSENRLYLFKYDGTRWIWVNAQSSDQVVVVGGTSGNVLTVASDGSIDGTISKSSLLSQTINSASAKTSLADSDLIGLVDSADSNILKKITWTNFKTSIGTGWGAIVNGLSSKTSPIGADVIAIGDSAATYSTKSLLLSNLYKALGTGTQDSTTYLRGDGTYALVPAGDKYPCEARLTLETGVAISSTDQNAKGTLYLTKFNGNQVAVYDGSSLWTTLILGTDLSITLSTLSSSLPHDVFAYNNSGSLAIEGLAWSNATTRATSLTTQDGIYVKSGDTTRRYIGTVYLDGSKQCYDAKLHRWVFNYYNRVDRQLYKDVDISHSYNSVTVRYYNNDSNQYVDFVCGIEQDIINASTSGQWSDVTTGSESGYSIIGLDGTSTTFSPYAALSMNGRLSAPVFISGYGVGYHKLTILESAVGTITVGNYTLSAIYRA